MHSLCKIGGLMAIKLTDEQWWSVSDYCSQPVNLSTADLERPFLYVRGYGVFCIGMGYHHIMCATIYAWQNGLEFAGDGITELGMSIDDMAEALTKQEGVAWRSNIGKDVIYASKISHAERSFLHNVEYIQ